MRHLLVKFFSGWGLPLGVLPMLPASHLAERHRLPETERMLWPSRQNIISKSSPDAFAEVSLVIRKPVALGDF